MTGFFENLTRHAAGLAPPPGMTAARLRPRARFEPTTLGGGEPPPLAVSSAEVESAQAPGTGETRVIRSAEDAPSSGTRRESARPEPMVRTDPDATSRPHSNLGSAPRVVEPAASSRTPEPASALSAANAEATVEHQRIVIAPDRTGTVDRDDRTREVPPRFPETRDAPTTPRVVDAPAAERTSPNVEQSQPPRSPEASAGLERTPAPARATTRLELGKPSTSLRREAPASLDDRTPAVSVSIGRIEVEVAPPPPAAARPQIERTRGFAGYARARRGQPR